MTAWETGIALAVVLLLVVNAVGAVLAARRLRALTIVLLDLEQRLRHAVRREGWIPESAPGPVDSSPPDRAASPSRPGAAGARLRLAWAALAAAAAIGLAVLAWSESTTDEGRPAARSLELTAQGARAQRLGSEGSIVLVVAASGNAVLVLSGLEPAPRGRLYRASAVADGRTRTLARFSGTTEVVPLGGPLPAGTVVTVALEPVGGARAAEPLFVSKPLP